jgi:hypothetical protein
MKKKIFRLTNCLLAVVAMASILSGCDDNNTNTEDPTVTYPTSGDNTGLATSEGILFSNGAQIGNGDSEFVFTGNKTISKGTYSLKGWVYVSAGATLTIEPGTIIKGDKLTKAALIVEKGGKLIAQGNANNPIVFTSAQEAGSRKPGDWGGLIICGKAPNNQSNDMQIEGGPRTHHGGTDATDNSGIISYVRVEFAGSVFATDKEINGLTLGSVGSGTQIDHVQISYANDDSYEWFGGTVNCKYLIAFKGWDDEFDTDNGFSGHVQFGLSVRDPRIADASQSNGFESDNCADGNSTATPLTKAIFSNITFIGPATSINSSFENTTTYITGGDVYPNNGSGLGKFQSAMQIRRSSNLNCFNSVAVGYPIGIIIDGEKGNSVTSAKNGAIKVQNTYFAGMTILGSDANKHYVDELGTYTNGTITYDNTQESYSSTFFKSQTGNKVYSSEDDLKLTGSTTTVGQNYMPTSASPLLGAASFTDSSLSSFTTTTYIGAFSGTSDSWMTGWTNFDPENTVY